MTAPDTVSVSHTCTWRRLHQSQRQNPTIPSIRPSIDNEYRKHKSGECMQMDNLQRASADIPSAQSIRPIITVHYEEISHLSISLHAVADTSPALDWDWQWSSCRQASTRWQHELGACRMRDACDLSGKSSAVLVADSRVKDLHGLYLRCLDFSRTLKVSLTLGLLSK